MFLQCSAVLGPNSVEHRIREEALCFGGDRCTATDVAIAAGVSPSDFCTHTQALSALPPAMVYASMREMRRMLEAVIDTMKVRDQLVGSIIISVSCQYIPIVFNFLNENYFDSNNMVQFPKMKII